MMPNKQGRTDKWLFSDGALHMGTLILAGQKYLHPLIFTDIRCQIHLLTGMADWDGWLDREIEIEIDREREKERERGEAER